MPGGTWTESILYTFAAAGDGAYPGTTLVIGHDGALYGTTEAGGAFGSGTVFRLTPPASPNGEWMETILHSFSGGQDGVSGTGDLTLGAGPVYYGTTESTVYSLAPPTVGGGSWTYAVLVGDLPLLFGGVALNKGTGALYAVTFEGGSAGLGSIFTLVPPTHLGAAWTMRMLHNFTQPGYPVEGVLLSKGVLYGATPGAAGSSNGNGTVFSYTLAP